MAANTNIRFEDWEAEQMKGPEFRAAVEELEPEYQAVHKEMTNDQTEMPKEPKKACPAQLCAGGLLWNEAVGDFGQTCSTCGGWGFVHDEAKGVERMCPECSSNNNKQVYRGRDKSRKVIIVYECNECLTMFHVIADIPIPNCGDIEDLVYRY